MSRRIGKPTTAGYVFLVAFIVIVVGIAVGATIVGGKTGRTIDIVGAILLVILIFCLFGANTTTRLPGDDPRDHFPEPPGPTGLH